MATIVDESESRRLIAELYPEFLAALLAGDRKRCDGLTQQAWDAGVPVLMLYQRLFQRALYQIGEEWAAHRVSVGIEHLATAIVEGLLNRLYPRVIAPYLTGRRVLISSVEGELHQIGAKMACDVFELHGWESLYLGADTPTAELLRTVRDLKPDVVGLSLSIREHLPTLREALTGLRAIAPTLPLLIGGQGLLGIGDRLAGEGPHLHYFAGLDDLECFVTALD